MKKLGLGILTALVLVSALTGAVFAQAEPPTDIPEARLERVAEMLSMTVEELQSALDSGQTIHDLAEAAGIELPERPEGTGPNGERPEGMGGRDGQLAELLGMTEEEIQAAIESGQSLQELAESAGIELPARPEGTGLNGERPEGMGGRNAQLAELLGMTEEEIQAAIESGQTIQELAEAAGIELPARAEGAGPGERPEGAGARGGRGE